jgi:predicted nucleotidyltransferase
MGTELSDVSAANDRIGEPSEGPREIGHVSEEPAVTLVPWLDECTAGLVRAMVAAVAERHPEFRAAILYGSVARHDERPLADPEPSDVDVLLLFDVPSGQADIPFSLYRAIFASIGLARQRYLYPPREVQPIPVASDLRAWDTAFVENVARDGLLLWARGPLPPCLAPVAARAVCAM